MKEYCEQPLKFGIFVSVLPAEFIEKGPQILGKDEQAAITNIPYDKHITYAICMCSVDVIVH